MAEHVLTTDHIHRVWDHAIPPALKVDSGDEVTIATLDSSGHYYTAGSTADDARRKPPFAGHPLTGPVYVEGARPGDVLQVDILSVQPGPLGYTAVYPGRALLGSDFDEYHLVMWDLCTGDTAVFPANPDIRIPLAPFCGVMGVALAEPGRHSTMPPRRVGGNMDVKQLTAGSTLYLPIEVDGALFSCGDAHAAQGDGEVCITAIECDAVSTFRLTLRRDLSIQETQARISAQRPSALYLGPYHVTMAHAPDLYVASQRAVRYMLDWLGQTLGLGRADAYILCSVAADLKISQVVDAPNWTVSCFLPLGILGTVQD